jgi:hypothetical protein
VVSETSSVLTTEASSIAATNDTPLAETSSLLTTDASSVVADDSSAPAAETSSAVVESTEAESSVVAAAPAETLPVAAVEPVSPVVTAGPVERWAAAGIVLVLEGQEWDNRSFANVDAALLQLPTSILPRLGNPALGPLHILVNTQGRSLSGQQPYGGAANYFSTNDGRNELVLYPGQSVFTVLHEMGHAFNLRNTPAGQYGRVVNQPEMRSFMTATGWEITSSPEQIASAVDHMALSFNYTGTFQWQGLSHFDPLEDFANSFAMYYSDRSGLAALSPERHGWLAANLPR